MRFPIQREIGGVIELQGGLFDLRGKGLRIGKTGKVVPNIF
ncbi:MAG: hypothetical protein ACOC44_02930 [Promethearchaeia archaeon]